MTPLGEAVAASAAGAALAGAVGSMAGVTAPAAIIGGLNGFVSGRRGIYDWRSPKGIGAFALDSTWALTTTFAGVVSHAVAAARGDAGSTPEVSNRVDGSPPRSATSSTVPATSPRRVGSSW